jgi:hypothetical protein
MVSDHKHIYQCQPYEEGIAREVCACGAVQFEVTSYGKTPEDKKKQRRVEELNRRYKRKGKKVALNIKDLHPETVHKLNLEEEKRLAGLLPIPPKPASIWARRDYYNDNRDQIIAEIKQFGEMRTRKRWGICKSTWINLKRRWEIPVRAIKQNRPKFSRPKKEKPPSSVHSKHNLPEFPPFDRTWPEAVCVKWLEVYAALQTGK